MDICQWLKTVLQVNTDVILETKNLSGYKGPQEIIQSNLLLKAESRPNIRPSCPGLCPGGSWNPTGTELPQYSTLFQCLVILTIKHGFPASSQKPIPLLFQFMTTVSHAPGTHLLLLIGTLLLGLVQMLHFPGIYS